MSSAAETPAPRRGLGRGLEVLVGGAAGGSELLHLPIDAIHPNPRQPRRRFEPEATSGLAAEVEAEVRRHFGELVFTQTVPRSVRLAEAPSHGLPAIAYDRRSTGAEAYWKVAMELVERS